MSTPSMSGKSSSTRVRPGQSTAPVSALPHTRIRFPLQCRCHHPPATQTVFTVPTGQLSTAAVQVSATGTYGNATESVTLDIAKALQAASWFAASTYNVYVAALVPGAAAGSSTPVIFVKPKAPATWGRLDSPIAAFLENVDAGAVSNQVVMDIVSNIDLSSLVGTDLRRLGHERRRNARSQPISGRVRGAIAPETEVSQTADCGDSESSIFLIAVSHDLGRLAWERSGAVLSMG